MRLLRSRSLARRIFMASCVMMPLLLGFSAYMLDKAFRDSLYAAEKESLLAHTYSMMGIAEPNDSSLVISQSLSDPRFSTPASGLYAQLLRSDDQYIIWQSTSLSVSPINGRIPFHEVPVGSSELLTFNIGKQKYFISRFNTVWEINDEDREYQFVVVHSQQDLKKELARYRNTLAIWLGGLAVLLIIVQTVIIRWGLLPLQQLAEDIISLEAGQISKLDDTYPDEIIPVTKNINFLLESEQNQQKRYKNTLADLAHSLKTPLSVIRSILESHIADRAKGPIAENVMHHNNAIPQDTTLKQSIDEQIDRMSSIVNHQLNRASAKSKAAFQSYLKLQPIFDRIGMALNKVYHDKHIELINNVDVNLQYPAEEGDLMEVFGNILENAFKYGRSKVHVNSIQHDGHISILIEDDGPGIPEAMHKEILNRGSRIDTSLPGQGIGLSVAADIISFYDGGIHVASSSLGGAKFTVDLVMA